MSTISMARGNGSAAMFQIHGVPSPITTWRSAVSKPRRIATPSLSVERENLDEPVLQEV